MLRELGGKLATLLYVLIIQNKLPKTWVIFVDILKHYFIQQPFHIEVVQNLLTISSMSFTYMPFENPNNLAQVCPLDLANEITLAQQEVASIL